MKVFVIFSFLRSCLSGIFCLLWTGVCSLFFILGLYGGASRAWADRMIVRWSSGVLWLFGVRVQEKGREHLPEGACLYLFNHTSFFDIFAMASRLPGMRFGSKVELFKIPIFGQAMRRAGVLPIARSNREKVFRVYDRAKEKAAQGQQFALAPEGSRNHREKLLPFKAGPFIFAINAQMPIVPVIIKGAHDIFPKNAILPNWKKWNSVITLEYLPTVSVHGESLDTRTKLQQRVFELMNCHFGPNA